MEPKAVFHHVALSVADLDESIEWYNRYFDLKVLSSMTIPHVDRMKVDGVEIAMESEPPEMPRYGAHVLDPTGNIVEIFQKDFDVSTIKQL